LLVDPDEPAQRPVVPVEGPVRVARGQARVERDRSGQVAVAIERAQVPVVLFVDLIGVERPLGGGPLSREGDVAELDAEETAELDVSVVGSVSGDGAGECRVIAEDAGDVQAR
jgi:hypothetical protein